MMPCEINSDKWRRLLQTIMLDGYPCIPRGQSSNEIIGMSQDFDMNYPVIRCAGRNLNTDFMIAEAAWILSGSNDIALPTKYMKTYAKYSDNNVVMSGAYGPAYHRQKQYVLDTLNEDPFSRQAVFTIWNERPAASKDIPCTVSLQFLIRGGHLHCVANMRSSDVFLGLPYDIFTFSMIAADIINSLDFGDLELGYLTWNAGSAHIYERDFSKAMACIDSEALSTPLYPYFDISNVEEHLKAILAGIVANWVVGDE